MANEFSVYAIFRDSYDGTHTIVKANQDAQVEWTATSDLYLEQPAVALDGGLICRTTYNDTLAKFSAADGSLEWEISQPGGSTTHVIATFDGVFSTTYDFADDNLTFHHVDDDGTVTEDVFTVSDVASSPPVPRVGPDGHIYLGRSASSGQSYIESYTTEGDLRWSLPTIVDFSDSYAFLAEMQSTPEYGTAQRHYSGNNYADQIAFSLDGESVLERSEALYYGIGRDAAMVASTASVDEDTVAEFVDQQTDSGGDEQLIPSYVQTDQISSGPALDRRSDLMEGVIAHPDGASVFTPVSFFADDDWGTPIVGIRRVRMTDSPREMSDHRTDYEIYYDTVEYDGALSEPDVLATGEVFEGSSQTMAGMAKTPTQLDTPFAPVLTDYRDSREIEA